MAADPGSVRLKVLTADGIEHLGRVIAVLALLDLTPSQLDVRRTVEGLQISAVLPAGSGELVRCLARLRALVSVRSVAIEPASGC